MVGVGGRGAGVGRKEWGGILISSNDDGPKNCSWMYYFNIFHAMYW